MLLRFTKQDPAVDSHFTDENDRVLVKTHEVPISPLYPEDDGYMETEFLHCLERVLDAKAKAPMRSGVADCFLEAGMNRSDKCAFAVHKDWPSDLMQIAAKDVVSKFGFRNLGLGGVFTNYTVLLDALIGLAGFYTSASSFCYKNAKRVPRPEEVAGAIARGEIGCPRRVAMMLHDHPDFEAIKEDQRKFTMFPEGSPGHASCGAMHSAAAAAAGFVIKVMTGDGSADIVDMCTLNVGDFRIDAGVHTLQDNNIGFWIGTRSARKWLWDYLSDLGADDNRLAEAFNAAETSWI